MRTRVKVAEANGTDRRFGGWILRLAMLAVVAVVLASCGEEQGTSNTPEGESESEGPARGVVVSDITDGPREYTGATVTVSGEVNDIAAPNAFTIGGEDFLGTEELLIVGARQLPNITEGARGGAEVQENDIVQVKGTVRSFDSATALEDEVDYSIDDRLFESYEGEPVVVAEKIWLTPRADRAGEQQVPATLADVTDDPEEYYGQNITVKGVVAETIEPSAFVLAPKGTDPEDFVADGVLVVGGSGAAPDVTEGRTVKVSGTFKEFDLAAFETDLGTDLDDGLYSDWAGESAIAAQQIQQMQGGETTSQ